MKLRTFCLACREHATNIGSNTVTVTNKVITGKSRSAECFSDKSRIMKQDHNKKSSHNEKVVIKHYKTNMLTYCLKCKKNSKKTPENKNAKMVKTKNGRLALSSKCAVCGSKKSRFMKKREAKGLLSNLGIKTALSKIRLLNVLF